MRSILMISVAAASLAACGAKDAAIAEAPSSPSSDIAASAPAADAPSDVMATAAAPEAASAGNARTFVDEGGVAINGYDPVSYFKGAPAPGDATFVSVVNGATYRFASAENKAEFDASPGAFEPQYGGYCAYGAAKGAKFPTKPETGVVIDGKLYFNKNADVQKLWTKDSAALIVEADSVWPAIVDDAPKG